MSTSVLFSITVSARPQNSGDGNNERYIAQAFALNGEALLYHGESTTLSAALQQLVNMVKAQEHSLMTGNAKQMRLGNFEPDGG